LGKEVGPILEQCILATVVLLTVTREIVRIRRNIVLLVLDRPRESVDVRTHPNNIKTSNSVLGEENGLDIVELPSHDFTNPLGWGVVEGTVGLFGLARH